MNHNQLIDTIKVMRKSNLTKSGVILAGGRGKRLKPATNTINKHLLLIYDKPMIYYPLTTLILAGVREIAIVCNNEDLINYKKLLCDGRHFGVKFLYFCQEKPSGIVDALKSCQEFWQNKPFVLTLGDNLFYGSGLSKLLLESSNELSTTIFGYKVTNPKEFGVIEFSKDLSVKKLVEKPQNPKSNIIATGLYFFNKDLSNYIDQISLSYRGEYEIADLLNTIAQEKKLKLKKLDRGITWLDMGTIENLILASKFIQNVQSIQGFMVGSPEEASWRMGNITKNQLEKLCKGQKNKYFL